MPLVFILHQVGSGRVFSQLGFGLAWKKGVKKAVKMYNNKRLWARSLSSPIINQAVCTRVSDYFGPRPADAKSARPLHLGGLRATPTSAGAEEKQRSRCNRARDPLPLASASRKWGRRGGRLNSSHVRPSMGVAQRRRFGGSNRAQRLTPPGREIPGA